MTDVIEDEDEFWEPEEGSIWWLNNYLSGVRCALQDYCLHTPFEEDTPENRARVEKAIKLAEEACAALFGE